MKSNKNGSTLIVGIVVIIIALIVAYITNSYLQKKLLFEAIDGCGKIAAQSDPNHGFNGAVYQVCLEDKGYPTVIGNQ